MTDLAIAKSFSDIGPVLGSVAVIGGGVSGLAAAYRLRAKGVAVQVFESENVAGGKVTTVAEDGVLWERGPNTMAENDPLVGRLIDELQLRTKQQFPALQSKRYIVRDGKPQTLPSNPFSFVGSKILSARAKLGIVLEPFMWKRRRLDVEEGHQPHDESVAQFMARHFGREVVDYLIDPFVAGTSAADPYKISARHTFPDLVLLEENHGSIIAGAFKLALGKRRSSKNAVTEEVWDENVLVSRSTKCSRGSFSFLGGLQTLANALVARIGKSSIHLNAPLVSLDGSQQGNPARYRWQVSYLEGPKRLAQQFDAVILTTPLHDFKQVQISKDGSSYSTDFIPEVVYQPVSVLVTSFHKDDVKRPLDGFGVLVPAKEQANDFQTLGTLFSSSMFPERAPSDQIVFTTFVGGSRNRKLAGRSVEELQEIVLRDLSRLLGVASQPVSVRHVYWERAFPEYSLGYDAVLSALHKVEADLSGVYFAGNMRGGLAVGKAIVSGYRAAERVIQYLEASGGRKIYTMASAQ